MLSETAVKRLTSTGNRVFALRVLVRALHIYCLTDFNFAELHIALLNICHLVFIEIFSLKSVFGKHYYIHIVW